MIDCFNCQQLIGSLNQITSLVSKIINSWSKAACHGAKRNCNPNSRGELVKPVCIGCLWVATEGDIEFRVQTSLATHLSGENCTTRYGYFLKLFHSSCHGTTPPTLFVHPQIGVVTREILLYGTANGGIKYLDLQYIFSVVYPYVHVGTINSAIFNFHKV